MGIVQILFISAVVIPAVAAIVLMLFVKNSKGGLKREKRVFEQKEKAFIEKEKTHKKVIKSLEKIVENQDIVLDAYRDNHPENLNLPR